MKPTTATILAGLLCSGCAFTRVKENGQEVFYTQANAKHLIVRTARGSTLEIDGLNHSTPTRAGGSVAGTIGSAAVSGITAAAAF